MPRLICKNISRVSLLTIPAADASADTTTPLSKAEKNAAGSNNERTLDITMSFSFEFYTACQHVMVAWTHPMVRRT